MTFDPPGRDLPKPENLTPPPPAETRSDHAPNHPSGQDPKDLFPLVPGSPRAEALLQAFKETIAKHLADLEGKTTADFIDGLALELWQLTRK